MIGTLEFFVLIIALLLTLVTQAFWRFKLTWIWSVPISMLFATIVTGYDVGSMVLLSSTLVVVFLAFCSNNKEEPNIPA